MYLGIEIGGTKLQLGIGDGNGLIQALWRGTVDVVAGAEGIRKQIVTAVPKLFASSGLPHSNLLAVGVGFGGPVDDAAQCIIKSHQVVGWDSFPLGNWLATARGAPAVLGNDADAAGLAEALYGAAKDCSPLFYITIGSGIGGGFVVDGNLYRAAGRGAAEIGHLRVLSPDRLTPSLVPLEQVASGWAIGRRATTLLETGEGRQSLLWQFAQADPEKATGEMVGRAVNEGDAFAKTILDEAISALADAICAVIVLVCPRRIVIGGGVSLIGERCFFSPLRQLVAERVFPPFAGLTDIVPAALGETVVVHGAIALAKRRFHG